MVLPEIKTLDVW